MVLKYALLAIGDGAFGAPPPGGASGAPPGGASGAPPPQQQAPPQQRQQQPYGGGAFGSGSFCRSSPPTQASLVEPRASLPGGGPPHLAGSPPGGSPMLASQIQKMRITSSAGQSAILTEQALQRPPPRPRTSAQQMLQPTLQPLQPGPGPMPQVYTPGVLVEEEGPGENDATILEVQSISWILGSCTQYGGGAPGGGYGGVHSPP